MSFGDFTLRYHSQAPSEARSYDFQKIPNFWMYYFLIESYPNLLRIYILLKYIISERLKRSRRLQSPILNGQYFFEVGRVSIVHVSNTIQLYQWYSLTWNHQSHPTSHKYWPFKISDWRRLERFKRLLMMYSNGI